MPFKHAWSLGIFVQMLVIPALGFNRSMYDLGTSIHVRVTFHELDRLAFLDLQDIMLSNVHMVAIGTQDSMVYRDLDSSQNNGPLGYEALVLFDFSPRDSTPASLVNSVISNNPENIFPPETFGASDVSYAGMLACSCGDHGIRVPHYTAASNSMSCTCQCDPGWDTDMSQKFESFKYCSIQKSSTDDAPVQNTSDPSWRPPVPLYPPPPPKTYKNESSGKLPLFKWAIIGASIIVLGMCHMVAIVLHPCYMKLYRFVQQLCYLFSAKPGVVVFASCVAALLAIHIILLRIKYQSSI